MCSVPSLRRSASRSSSRPYSKRSFPRRCSNLHRRYRKPRGPLRQGPCFPYPAFGKPIRVPKTQSPHPTFGSPWFIGIVKWVTRHTIPGGGIDPKHLTIHAIEQLRPHGAHILFRPKNAVGKCLCIIGLRVTSYVNSVVAGSIPGGEQQGAIVPKDQDPVLCDS